MRPVGIRVRGFALLEIKVDEGSKFCNSKSHFERLPKPSQKVYFLRSFGTFLVPTCGRALCGTPIVRV